MSEPLKQSLFVAKLHKPGWHECLTIECSRAVEPEHKHFWMAGAGVNIFSMVEPGSEFWVPVPRKSSVEQANCTNSTMFLLSFWTKLF